MTQPRRIRTSLDLLTAVPEMLGYEPHESLVLLPFSDNRGGAIMRLDLPPLDSSPGIFASAVVAQLRRFPDCNRVAVASYTAEPLGLDAPPHRPMIDALADLAALAGITVTCAVVRAGDGWCDYRGEGAGTLEELEQFAASRPAVAPSLESTGDIAPADDAARGRFARALRGAHRRGASGLAGFVEAWGALIDGADGEAAPDEERAAVVAGLVTPLNLEYLLADAAFGCETGLEHALVWQHVARELAAIGDESHEPGGLVTERAHIEPVDLDRSKRAIALLRELVALAPRTAHAELYAVLGWLEWARGGATLATRYARESLQLDSDQPLAGEVEVMCAFGVAPAWIGLLGVGGGFVEDDYARLLEAE